MRSRTPGRAVRAVPFLRVAEVDLGGDSYVVLSYPTPALGAAGRARLSGAERDVLAHLLEGLTNAEIARRRGTATRTVANQVASILRKLRLGSRAELAARLR